MITEVMQKDPGAFACVKAYGHYYEQKKSAKINAKIQLVLPYTQSQSISKNGKGITYKYNCPELR